ncbi:hypothetical protein [Tateyamaria sp.]|uniref:hypothetical protein n=1 Tax=Tateyamaria sp. TaxID=1929288 RepID=UPI00329C1E8E
MEYKQAELSPQLQWSLQALAQDSETQFALYQCYNEAADDLVLDFETYVLREDENFLSLNQDIAQLDDLIESKSGIQGFWNAEAMRNSDFWQEIRLLSKKILDGRGLPTSAPEPIPNIFINVDEVPKDGWKLLKFVRWLRQ